MFVDLTKKIKLYFCIYTWIYIFFCASCSDLNVEVFKTVFSMYWAKGDWGLHHSNFPPFGFVSAVCLTPIGSGP